MFAFSFKCFMKLRVPSLKLHLWVRLNIFVKRKQFFYFFLLNKISVPAKYFMFEAIELLSVKANCLVGCLIITA